MLSTSLGTVAIAMRQTNKSLPSCHLQFSWEHKKQIAKIYGVVDVDKC